VSWWWSWLLAVVSAGGLLVAGTRRRSGWLIGMLVQPVWAAYAIGSRQWGFLASVVLFSYVNVRNWVRWGEPAVDGDRAVLKSEDTHGCGAHGEHHNAVEEVPRRA
jgi:hypothetical protein